MNIKSANNLTPLMVAAAKGHEKAVKKLMRLGAIFQNDNNEVDQRYHSSEKSENSMGSSYNDEVSSQNSNYVNEPVPMPQMQCLTSQSSFSNKDKREREGNALELALQNRHHGIVEMLLRDMTLKDAVRNDQNNTN